MSTVRVYKHQVQPKHTPANNNVSIKFLEKQRDFKKQAKLNSIVINSLIIALVAFVSLQLIRGTFINLDRYLTLNNKMNNLTQLNAKVTYQSAVLKKQYKSYTSPEGLEGLARDYLNLVGDNEIAIILKQS